MLYRLATLAAPAIFAPFPSIWRHFSPRPVLAPVQKFNAIKQPPFRFRCKLLTFTDFADLLRGGIVARLWEIVEILGVSVRNRACSSIEPCLKSVLCSPSTRKAPKIVHILHKIGSATANAVPFGLFLLSAIAYLKIAFYLCTSNPPKGVARSFKDFPPASLGPALVLRHAGHASATHEELKTAFC